MRKAGYKQDVYDRIRRVLRLPKAALGPGAKEHKPTLVRAARRVGITAPHRFSKQVLCAKIVATAGRRWDKHCWSTGQTITREGLIRVLAAIQRRATRNRLRVRHGFGKPYRHWPGPVNRSAATRLATFDPDALDRATKAHQDLLAAVEGILRGKQIQPRAPRGRDPRFDLGWTAGGARVVLEAKSTTKRNRVHQERLGVGQLLEYLAEFKQLTSKPARGVLAVSGQPRRETLRLCKYLGILVVWPPKLGERLRPVLGP